MEHKALLLKVRESLWKRAVDREIRRLVDSVFAKPLVVFPGGWHDTIPKWIHAQVSLERMAQFMKGETGEVTDAEALAYLYTASLTAPMSYDWGQVYFYLVKKVMGDKFPTNLFKESDPYVAGLKGLTPQQEKLLKDLKSWIYRQQSKRDRASMRRG